MLDVVHSMLSLEPSYTSRFPKNLLSPANSPPVVVIVAVHGVNNNQKQRDKSQKILEKKTDMTWSRVE